MINKDKDPLIQISLTLVVGATKLENPIYQTEVPLIQEQNKNTKERPKKQSNWHLH